MRAEMQALKTPSEVEGVEVITTSGVLRRFPVYASILIWVILARDLCGPGPVFWVWEGKKQIFKGIAGSLQ